MIDLLASLQLRKIGEFLLLFLPIFGKLRIFFSDSFGFFLECGKFFLKELLGFERIFFCFFMYFFVKCFCTFLVEFFLIKSGFIFFVQVSNLFFDGVDSQNLVNEFFSFCESFSGKCFYVFLTSKHTSQECFPGKSEQIFYVIGHFRSSGNMQSIAPQKCIFIFCDESIGIFFMSCTDDTGNSIRT